MNKSEKFLKPVIYQLFLRAFTQEGTINAAAQMLENIKDLGADIVYLCPFFEQDDDENTDFWSNRQKLSGIENSKNPYRIKDYFKIDSEYGTEDDLINFVNKAHNLGLKVLFDIVYFHCGPKSVLLDMNPEFIQRDETGNPVVGDWKFPMLNFNSDSLREYLYSNMEYLIKKFDIDGYRADIGDMVPLDFWVEGRKRIEKIKPDVLMLNEGANYENAFDYCYDFDWVHKIGPVFKGELPATELTNSWNDKLCSFSLRSLENHDIVNDAYENRLEAKIGHSGVEAMLVLNFTIDGVPFIYNGNEICDSNRHSIYSNRFFGKAEHINWRMSATKEGKYRTNLIKELCFLRKNTPELYNGKVEWIENEIPEKLISFSRDKKVLVFVNTSNDYVSTQFSLCKAVSPLLKKDAVFISENDTLKISLLPYGYLVLYLQ